jgi:hypothetical protein
MRVPFSAEDASASFTCCGSSTSVPAFELPLVGSYDFDGGGTFELVLPADAPFGTYAMNLICPTSQDGRAFAIEVNDAPTPVVHSINAEIAPTEAMLVKGEHLDTITSIGAFRLADGAYFECAFALADRKATSVACIFVDIPASQTRDDYYIIDVASETCGSAADAPLFLVSPPVP